MIEAEPYNFTDRNAHQTADLSTIGKLMVRLPEFLTAIFEKALASKVEVQSAELESLTFDTWSTDGPALTSLSVFEPVPFGGTLLIKLDQQLVSAILEINLGGSLNRSFERSKADFSSLELTMVERLTKLMVDQMLSCFTKQKLVSATRLTHESNAKHLDICSEGDVIFRKLFTVSAGKKLNWELEIVFTESFANAVIEDAIRVSSQHRKLTNSIWQEQWLKNLKQVHFPLRAVLAQPNMSLPKLFELKVGDLIPITPRLKPPLFVANRRYATGTLGEKDGGSAFKIAEIEKEKHHG